MKMSNENFLNILFSFFFCCVCVKIIVQLKFSSDLFVKKNHEMCICDGFEKIMIKYFLPDGLLPAFAGKA